MEGLYIQSLAPSDNSIWNYLKRVKQPFVPIPPLRVDNGFACTDSEKIEALADQAQFLPHPDVFDPKTIDKVYNIIEIFSDRAAVREIPPTTPTQLNTFQIEKPQETMELITLS